MEQDIRISVRNLVEFILRSGDIDNRKGTMADREAMQKGSRIHRKIQGRMGASYQSEVYLSHTFDFEAFSITVEGRADGIFQEEHGVMVDEIKGIFRDLEYLKEPVPVHLAQAKSYAYLYALKNGLERIGVQMSYCNLETEEMKYFREEFAFSELEQWFLEILEEYKKWAAFQIKWRGIRQESIHRTEFPFPYREGQRDLAAAVYRTIARKKKLFIQAPTGAGKTLSVVFPAVKAVGEGLGDRIFYLTAKTIARTVAEEAFGLLKEQGLEYKVITLTAKEKICRCGEMECNPDACPYAKGHYDRVNDAVYEMITQQERYGREEIEAQADKWRVCPFELSLDVSLWADAVICDYNYVFDPRARLKRFFSENAKGEYLFLIDEAHNLVERGREMFSARLYKEEFTRLRREVREKEKTGIPGLPRGQGARLRKALGQCSRQLQDWQQECTDYRVLEGIGTFPIYLMNLCGLMEKFLEDSKERELNEKVLELYFQVRSFLDICDRLDECYVIYCREGETDGFFLRLYCVDPSVNLQECLDRGLSTVYFSATLLPIDYYKSLLSRVPDDYAVYAHSCFDVSRRQVLVCRDTSTRYTSRTPQEYQRIAAYIRTMALARQGNYLVFFSSYRMLEDISACFEEICPEGMRIIRQNSRMSEQEREEFLAAFEEGGERSLVGFCVMGSIFGEGIDLKRDRLIGAAIVGAGLPQVCCEREILKNYYDRRGMDGFRYAYLCPGMNKVLQAAGRVIRTEEDRGVILLLDERFTRYQYREMFPREWADLQVCTLNTAEEKIKSFWEKSI